MPTQPSYSDLDFLSANRILNLLDGVDLQEPATVAQLSAILNGLAWKDNCRVATQGNTNLSSPGATIDGITMAANDRILVRSQTSQPENGIYIWNAAATPATRAGDADSFTELESAVVTVDEGTSGGATFRQTQVNGTLGTNNIIWQSFGTAAPSASETVAGIAEIATQAETDAGTDDLRFITPLKFKTSTLLRKKYSQDFGDGSSQTNVITHNLGTDDVTVAVWEKSGNKRLVIAEIRNTSINSITIVAKPAIGVNAARVVITG